MKSLILGTIVFLSGASAYAGCVGTDPSYTQYCAMVTDQSECAKS